MPEMHQLLLTTDEINVLAIAAAKGIDPEANPSDAHEASAIIWQHGLWNPTLCSLATMMAEATYR